MAIFWDERRELCVFKVENGHATAFECLCDRCPSVYKLPFFYLLLTFGLL